MRRFFRVLFKAATGLSLILFAATIVLWVRGRTRVEQIIWTGHVRTLRGSSASDSSLVQSDAYLASVGGMLRAEYQSRRLPEPAWAERPDWRVTSATVPAEDARSYARMMFDLVAADHRRRIWLPGGRFEYRMYVFPDYHGRARVTTRQLIIPCWLIAAATLPLPALHATRALGRARRHRRIRRGMCPACGYDLRATPDRCPECGAVPSNANAGKTTKAAP